MGIGNNERDQFGNWASAWARTSSGSFDIVPTVTKGTDGSGNPYVTARCTGNIWTTDGYAEVGTSVGNSYDSASSVATVSGIGSIHTEEDAGSGYGQIYSTQTTGATLGDYGSANANSQLWGSGGNANANAYIDGSGSLSGYLGVGYDGSFLGSFLDVDLANSGYGTASISASYGDYYMGGSSVNANVNNGAISSTLNAQRTSADISTSGNIRNIAGEYGRIDLNSNAYSTGADSNKNAEFWYGFGNSYVLAGTDGYSAWTSWEAPA
jgi:hypothetical protein